MSDDRLKGLADELRRWAQRPASLSPAAARTRVLASLPGRERQPVWRLLMGGVTLAAIVLAVVLLVDRSGEPIVAPPATAAASSRTIVHQLSSGTRLYIVVRPDSPTLRR